MNYANSANLRAYFFYYTTENIIHNKIIYKFSLKSNIILSYHTLHLHQTIDF